MLVSGVVISLRGKKFDVNKCGKAEKNFITSVDVEVMKKFVRALFAL